MKKKLYRNLSFYIFKMQAKVFLFHIMFCDFDIELIELIIINIIIFVVLL